MPKVVYHAYNCLGCKSGRYDSQYTVFIVCVYAPLCYGGCTVKYFMYCAISAKPADIGLKNVEVVRYYIHSVKFYGVSALITGSKACAIFSSVRVNGLLPRLFPSR